MEKLSTEELKRLSPQDFKKAEKHGVCVILDNIRSLHNIGSVFRTSDALGIEKIYLCGITASPPHREIQKTALGATESVAWEYHTACTELIRKLKEKNYRIVAVEQAKESVFLQNYRPKINSKIALVFGNEVEGVSQEVMEVVDECIEIPQFGTKHSFNISVSAAIVLWELLRERIKNETIQDN